MTQLEQKVLSSIKRYFAEHECSPTISEIADDLNLQSRGTVHRYVQALIAKGYLYRQGKGWRGLVLSSSSPVSEARNPEYRSDTGLFKATHSEATHSEVAHSELAHSGRPQNRPNSHASTQTMPIQTVQIQNDQGKNAPSMSRQGLPTSAEARLAPEGTETNCEGSKNQNERVAAKHGCFTTSPHHPKAGFSTMIARGGIVSETASSVPSHNESFDRPSSNSPTNTLVNSPVSSSAIASASAETGAGNTTEKPLLNPNRCSTSVFNFELAKQADDLPNLRIPLLGKIAAGLPIEAISNEEHLDLAGFFIGPDRYALRVTGNSMMEVGILDGDTVIVKKQSTARTGDIVVALIDGQEATLKRLGEYSGGAIELIPENTDMTTMRYAGHRVSLQGVVVGQMRSY